MFELHENNINREMVVYNSVKSSGPPLLSYGVYTYALPMPLDMLCTVTYIHIV